MSPNVKTPVLFIISGLSGTGKSTAMAALEDAGFYCIDNMPVDLLPKFLETLEPPADTEEFVPVEIIRTDWPIQGADI